MVKSSRFLGRALYFRDTNCTNLFPTRRDIELHELAKTVTPCRRSHLSDEALAKAETPTVGALHTSYKQSQLGILNL